MAWSRLAETCGEYLKKGSRLYFEGSLQTRSWEDRDGNTRYTTEVKVRDMMMLDGRESGIDTDQYEQTPQRARPRRPQSRRKGSHPQDLFGPQDTEDLFGPQDTEDLFGPQDTEDLFGDDVPC